ncbi:MAG: O-antigen ligase family protein [Chloroflexi bacterium]|nr:O-antigen ligase family protein [Chloroflexota bacterium]
MLVLLAPLLLLLTVISIARPAIGVAAVVGFAFVTVSKLPTLAEFGELSVRFLDIGFGLLILVILIRIVATRRMPYSRELPDLFVPLLPFLLYVGASLILVYLSTPQHWASSSASYLRLVQTAFMVPLVYLSLEKPSDVKLLVRILITFGVLSVGFALVESWSAQADASALQLGAGRYGGLLGPNSLGLVSGMLLIYALISRSKASFPLTTFLTLAGLAGLILSKSAMATLAAAGTVGLYLVAQSIRKITFREIGRIGVVAALLLLGAGVTISVLRPGDAGGLLDFREGSFAQRLMIAYAGLRIFLETPILGVGWQISGIRDVIGDPQLNMLLRQQFPSLPQHYFLDILPTSLHNMYIQILAELGAVGFALFTYAVVQIGKSIVRIVGTIEANSDLRTKGLFYAFSLLYLLLWWNSNALFGGQTESILAFTFLGAIAAIGRISRRISQESIDGTSTLLQPDSAHEPAG